MEKRQSEFFTETFDSIGFGTTLNLQMQFQFEHGARSFELFSKETKNEKDRMFYWVNARISEQNEPFYNGIRGMLVRNLPVTIAKDGIDLPELEQRLAFPPTNLNDLRNAGEQQEYDKALSEYLQSINEDMQRLYRASRDIFYKLVAVYKPPLPQQLVEAAQAPIEKLLGRQILKQWFPADKGLGKDGVFQLLDSNVHPRAVYVTKLDATNQVFGQWVSLDHHSERTEHGNLLFETFHDNYGFNIRAAAANFRFAEFQSAEGLEAACRTMEEGKAFFSDKTLNADWPEVFTIANPKAKTLSIVNIETGKYLPLQAFLTEAAQQERAQKNAGKASGEQTHGPAPASGSDGPSLQGPGREGPAQHSRTFLPGRDGRGGGHHH